MGRHHFHRCDYGGRHPDRHGHALGRRSVHRPFRRCDRSRRTNDGSTHHGLHDSRVRANAERACLALALAVSVRRTVLQQVAMGRDRVEHGIAAGGDLHSVPQHRFRYGTAQRRRMGRMPRPCHDRAHRFRTAQMRPPRQITSESAQNLGRYPAFWKGKVCEVND